MINLKFKVNGEDVNVDVEESARLLDILRETLGLTATKEGCSVGECGACTVIMNGGCSAFLLGFGFIFARSKNRNRGKLGKR